MFMIPGAWAICFAWGRSLDSWLSPLLQPPEIQYPVLELRPYLQNYRATATLRHPVAVGGRDLPTASGPLHGSLAAVSRCEPTLAGCED